MSLKKLFFFTILLVSFSAYCAVETEVFPAQNNQKIEPKLNSKINHYLKQAQEALHLADANAPPQSYHYELIAADFYIKAGALSNAKPLLEMLSYSSLPRSLKLFKEQLEKEYDFKSQQQKADSNTVPINHNTNHNTDKRSIALFLPLSGAHAQAAQAIKAGFLAQHHAQIQNEATPLDIKVYDTSQHSDLGMLYGKALAEGSDFIVGPLIKSDVQKLSQIAQAGSPVPILALNLSSDIKEPGLDNFFQFALSPEEEAQLLAQKAWQDGHHSTSIIVPDNEWGKRVLDSFSTKWRSLGGKIPSVALINNNNPQAAIQKLLQVRTNIKPPSRRKDIDMIVLATSAMQARQLRPLLNFYYANDLPIYSTSSIYQGKPQPDQDNDLNGIIFCDMPWILDNRHDSNDPFHHSARLYAMGLDAYQLVSRLSTLSESPNTEYQGATGILSIGPNHIIERKLNWAQIKDGVPQLYEPQN